MIEHIFEGKRFMRPTAIAPKITVTVDPVNGDDFNDGVTAPIATLARASEFDFGHYSGRIYLRNTGTHYLPLINAFSQTDGRNNSDVPVFGSPHNVLVIEGEPTVQDSFVVQSADQWVVTKDSSTPDWTPNEHVGRFILTNPFLPVFPNFFLRWPIVSNTATTLEIPGRYGALNTPGVDVDIVTNPVIKPNPAEVDNAHGMSFATGSNVELVSVSFDGNDQQFRLISNRSYLAPAHLRLYGCALYNGYSGGGDALITTGDLTVTGCYFNDLGGGVSHSDGSVRVDNCFFNDVSTCIQVTEGGYMYYSQPNAMQAVSAAVFDIRGAEVRYDDTLGYDTFKLDTVADFCRLQDQGFFKMETQFSIRPGFASVTGYAVRLLGTDGLAELFDTANTPLTAGTSYFRIGTTNLSDSDYVTLYDANVEYEHDNRVRDV